MKHTYSKFALFIILSLIFILPVTIFADTLCEGACGNNTYYSVSDKGSLTISGSGNMNDYIPSTIPWNEQIGNITSVSISDTVLSIGANSFINISVSDITIPKSVITIGAYAVGYNYDGTAYSKISGLKIHGESGSEAENYAKSNGFTFISTSPVVPNGKIGSVSWSISSDGTLTLSGNGEISNFTSAGATPWSPYINGKDGFKIQSITISNGITYIGDHAFEGVHTLTNINIPSSVKKIGISAFGYCDSLTNVYFSSGLIEISDEAFIACPITAVDLPDTVTYIGNKAFYGCDSLRVVSIKGVKTIGNSAFASCHSLTDLLIHNDIITIGDSAFEDCTNLQAFGIPDSVTSIGNRTFCGCSSISSVTIPKSVTSLGSEVFANCTSLKSVIIEAQISEIPVGTFDGCTVLKTVEISSNIQIISDRAFSGCPSITNITIPKSVKAIAPYSLGYIINGAYYSPVNSFTISGYTPSVAMRYAKQNGFGFNSIGNVQSDGGNITETASWSINTQTGNLSITGTGEIPDFIMFADTPWSTYYEYIRSIEIDHKITSVGNYAFDGCTSVTSVSLGNALTRIGSYSFSNTSVPEVIIPKNVTEIGESAFEGCGLIQNVTLPDGLKLIDQNAFRGCDLLKKIYIPKDTAVGYNSIGYLIDDTVIVDFVICGSKGSLAESYASYNRIKFKEEGFIEISDIDTGASVQILDPNTEDSITLKFEKISDTAGDNVFLKSNEYGCIYRYTLKTLSGKNYIPQGNIQFKLPNIDFDVLSLKIYSRIGDSFIPISFEYNGGMIEFSNSVNTDFILTNADLDELIPITVKYVFVDGKTAHEDTIAFASKDAEYSIRSAWIKGYKAKSQTIEGVAKESTTVSFVYETDTSVTDNTSGKDKNSTDNGNGTSVGKIILIILLILVGIGLIIGAVLFIMNYLKKKKDTDERKRIRNSRKTFSDDDKFASTIIMPDIKKKSLDIESLFSDEPEEDIDAVNKQNDNDKE